VTDGERRQVRAMTIEEAIDVPFCATRPNALILDMIRFICRTAQDVARLSRDCRIIAATFLCRSIVEFSEADVPGSSEAFSAVRGLRKGAHDLHISILDFAIHFGAFVHRPC